MISRLLPVRQHIINDTSDTKFWFVLTAYWRCFQSDHLENTNVQQKKSNKTWTLPGIRHAFCIDCFVGQAKAATTDMPLANGGIGYLIFAVGCIFRQVKCMLKGYHVWRIIAGIQFYFVWCFTFSLTATYNIHNMSLQFLAIKLLTFSWISFIYSAGC